MIARADTGMFISQGISEVGFVILSEAKNLYADPRKILRFAQNDRRDWRVSNNLPVSALATSELYGRIYSTKDRATL